MCLYFARLWGFIWHQIQIFALAIRLSHHNASDIAPGNPLAIDSGGCLIAPKLVSRRLSCQGLAHHLAVMESNNGVLLLIRLSLISTTLELGSIAVNNLSLASCFQLCRAAFPIHPYLSSSRLAGCNVLDNIGSYLIAMSGARSLLDSFEFRLLDRAFGMNLILIVRISLF